MSIRETMPVFWLELVSSVLLDYTPYRIGMAFLLILFLQVIFVPQLVNLICYMTLYRPQDEAFALWHEQWAKLYPEGSQSREVIKYITNNYVLVNLVDNDFPRETCLFDLVKRMLQMREEGPTEGQAVVEGNSNHTGQPFISQSIVFSL